MKRPNDGLGSGGLSPFNCILKHFLRPTGGLGSGGLSLLGRIFKHFLRTIGGLGSGALRNFGRILNISCVLLVVSFFWWSQPCRPYF